MATSFKNISASDRVETSTKLHESIPVTGTLVSGTYDDSNIKTYSHGYFQSVYDYPYLSSSANKVCDISFGYYNTASIATSSNEANTEKISVYNSMAQVLMGYDTDNNVVKFNTDGDSATTDDEVILTYFINFSRLLTKDEIKKGTFNLELGVSSSASGTVAYDGSVFGTRVLLTDASGSNGYFVNSPAGEYGVLYATSSQGTATPVGSGSVPAGLVFYQAGVAVIDARIFDSGYPTTGLLDDSISSVPMVGGDLSSSTIFDLMTGSTITEMADGFRNRLYNMSFQNTTELNSTIYFCRAYNGDFNYSTNPTYLNSSQIVVKNNDPTNEPFTYVTTVGLYSADNQLLAVGKLSEPVRKSPSNELTLRVRLDY